MSATEREFTVFAVYADNHQRHSDCVLACDANDAQHVYDQQMSPHQMLIAGVAEGHVKSVDEQDNAEWPSMSDEEEAG